MIDRLFVYGSLLSEAGHEMGARLAREAANLGKASFPGELFKLSWYPGVVESPNGSLVQGELHKLIEPHASLVWLDAYEGLKPGTLRGEEYERVARRVTLLSGDDVEAWIYLYRGSTVGLTRIVSGCWLDRVDGGQT